MKKILVPVDLSGATVRVCQAAALLAKALNGRMHILHAVSPPPPVFTGYYAFTANRTQDLYRASRKRAARRLQALGHWLAKRHPGTRVVMHAGPAARVILRTARLLRPDYIVMGSHGHTAAYDLLVGSATHGVMRKAPCPVVVVPITRTAKPRF